MKKSLVIFFLFSTLTFGLQAQSLKPLKSKFYPTLNLVKTTEQNTVSTYLAEGKSMESKMIMSMNTKCQIESPKENEQTVNLQIKVNSGSMEVMGKIQDIPNTEVNILSMVINNSGNIDRVTNGTEYIEQMKQSGVNGLQIGKPLSFFVLVPSEKKPGDAWVDSTFSKELMTTHFTYVKNEGNLAVLEYYSDVKYVNTINQNGLEIRSDMGGKINGFYKVNTENNYIMISDAKMNLEGRMEINAREIPVTIKASITESSK